MGGKRMTKEEKTMNVVAVKQSYDSLIEKYKSAQKPIEDFIEQKSKYYSKMSQDNLEKFGFENGEKMEFIPAVADSIQLRQMNYKKLKRKKEVKKEGVEEGRTENNYNQFILDTNKLPKIIDHAIGKIEIDGIKYRYMGVYLQEFVKEIITNKGESKEIIKRKKSPSLILETGEIISPYTKPDGLFFEFESLMTLKENRWSLESINDFCTNNFNKEDYCLENVYNSFKEKYDNSMAYNNSTWYKLESLLGMTTYFNDLIDKFLIVKHEGISGTAKSKGMKIGANLSFNGKKFLCPNPANFFRYRHNNKATIFIEEAEKLFDTSKKQNLGDSEMVEYLNGSYEKGNTVPRQNDKDRNQTDEFDPAGFTRIGSINPLKGALEKRSIPLHMIKASSKDKRGNVEIPTEKDKSYINSRNKAYICSLLNYKEYEKALEEVENKYNLVNRQWLVSKPIIAMAKCISKELEEEIGNFLVRLFEIRDDSFDDKSWERILSKILVKVYCVHKNNQFLSVEDIKSLLSPHISGVYTLSNTKTGMLMVKLGFSDYKKNTGEERGYEIDFFNLCEILIKQEWLTKENIQNIVSLVSECKFTKESIEEWYSYTFLTPYTSEKKEEENTDTLTPITPIFDGKGKNIDFSDSGIKEDLEDE